MKGHISTEHTVWCGARIAEPHPPFYAEHLCGDWWQFSESPPARTARAGGWVRTRAFGWLCAACAKKRQERLDEIKRLTV